MYNEELIKNYISVIIPVYNAERYLPECFESLRKQEHTNFEVIFIDDGSTDSSKKLCEKYSYEDQRIKIISQAHKGPASARNKGLKEAKGEFIFLLDADDILEKDALRILLDGYLDSNAEFVIGNFKSMKRGLIDERKDISMEEKILEEKEIIYQSRLYLRKPNKNLLFAFAWGRLFKTEIIKKNNLEFNEELHNFEDVSFNFDYLNYVKKIYFIKKKIYVHRIYDNVNSATMNIKEDPKKLFGYIQAIESAKKFLKNKIDEFILKKEAGHACITLTIIQLVRICGQITKDNEKEIFELVEEVINDFKIRKNLKFYSPSEEEDKVIPVLIKLKIVGLIISICKGKSDKRYGKRQDKVEEIKSKDVPVIIFGASTVGEVLCKACCEKGIKVECFCDNNLNKTANTFCGFNVIHTPKLKEKYNEAIFLISTADIKDAVEQLSSLGYSQWYPLETILKNFDIYQYKFDKPIDFVEYAINTARLCQDSFVNPDKLFLRSVDIIITEKCSLKCRDCSNLMQYYENPQDCDTQDILRDIERFCEIIDEVNEFRVIGGEPFMKKDFHIIVKRLIDEFKVKKVVIYTNGTIVPNEEQIKLLKNKKVFVLITDYGELSRNLDRLSKTLEENNIEYYAQKTPLWTDCSKIYNHFRSLDDKKKIFRKCCAKNTITLTEGKLYRCPFAANIHRLKASPDFKEDYIDIINEENINRIKQKIKDFLLKKDFLDVCGFCNGRSFDDPPIIPAIQREEIIKYKKY